jgi:hypothetical protein
MITIYFIPLFLFTGLYALWMGHITRIDYVIQAVLSIVIAIISSFVATAILSVFGL